MYTASLLNQADRCHSASDDFEEKERNLLTLHLEQYQTALSGGSASKPQHTRSGSANRRSHCTERVGLSNGQNDIHSTRAPASTKSRDSHEFFPSRAGVNSRLRQSARSIVLLLANVWEKAALQLLTAIENRSKYQKLRSISVCSDFCEKAKGNASSGLSCFSALKRPNSLARRRWSCGCLSCCDASTCSRPLRVISLTSGRVLSSACPL